MSKKCDIKESAKAWNDGLDAFKKAFKVTGGKTTESITFALNEIASKNENFDFNPDSFVKPLLKSLKDKNIVPKNYTFSSEEEAVGFSKTEKRVLKQDLSEEKLRERIIEKMQSDIKKVADKMKSLDANQKKEFSKKAFKKFNKDKIFTNDDVKNIYYDVVGIPAMNEEVDLQIKKLAYALQKEKMIEESLQSKIRYMQADKNSNKGKLSDEKNAEYEKAFAEIEKNLAEAKNNSMKEAHAFANLLIEKKFWLHQLTDYMPLNLMNPNSLLKNMSGAVVDGLIRTMGNTMASPISYAVSRFTKINSNPIGSRAKGAIKSKSKQKASAAWKYGMTEFNNELPRANHLNAANRWRRAMDESGFNKFKGLLSATLKIHPDLISKGLTAPDAVVYEMVKSGELNRIADSNNLTGAERMAFMLAPDEKSENIAHSAAKEVTFKQDLPDWMSPIKKLSEYDPHERSKKLIAEGWNPRSAKMLTGLRAIVQKTMMPFIKTPINIIRTASKILLPEYTFGAAILEAKKEANPTERQRMIIDASARLTASMFIRHVALQLIAQGLISAGYNDEDYKTRDVVEQELGGPNRVNLSAFIRGLSFRDMTPKDSDIKVDLNSLGANGIVLAVYAHAFNKFGKEDLENNTQYNKNLLNAISIPKDLAVGTIATSLDFTFFSGINQHQQALLDKEGKKDDKLVTQYIVNAFTGVVPSTVQKFSTQWSPDVKKQFDKDLELHENISNIMGYDFAFQSKELQNKYFSLAEKEGGGEKKKRYVLFDNYLGRLIESELDFAKVTTSSADSPIHRLYKASREVESKKRDDLFPSSISNEISMPYRQGGKNKTEKVKLTPEQYDYLREQASNYRMLLATPFIMSEDFNKFDHEAKAKVLSAAYSQGLDMAKKDLKSKYPDIRAQKVSGETSSEDVKKAIKKYKKH